MEIKAPLEIDYENESIDQIVEKIEYAIEQHPSFLKVIPQEELMAEEEIEQLKEMESEKLRSRPSSVIIAYCKNPNNRRHISSINVEFGAFYSNFIFR